MHHFFVEPSQIREGKVYISGGDVNHIKNVLRVKSNEVVAISDGTGRRYLCRIAALHTEQAVLLVQEEDLRNTELPSRLYLFQGLPKSDKMELIIQKAVELGVFEIIPVVTKRSIIKLDEKKAGKKVERWNAISLSAAKQSDRNRIPQVKQVMSYVAALQYAEALDITLIPYELAEGMAASKKIIEQILPGQSIGIFIGPEGGFEQQEIAQAMESGALPITLGKRILRTETAGLAALSILMYHLEQ